MFNQELVRDVFQELNVFEYPNWPMLLNHLTGVAHIAKHMATVLQLPDGSVDIIETAGWLHDLGKAIDDSVPASHVIKMVGFLRGRGVDIRVVAIVETHQPWVFEQGEIPEPETTEEKVLFLADLMFGGCFMPLKERVEALIDKYSKFIPAGRDEWLRRRSEEIKEEFLIINSNIFSIGLASSDGQ